MSASVGKGERGYKFKILLFCITAVRNSSRIKWTEITTLFRWYLHALFPLSQRPSELVAKQDENDQLIPSEAKSFEMSSLFISLCKLFSSANSVSSIIAKYCETFITISKKLFKVVIIVSDVKSETNSKYTGYVTLHTNKTRYVFFRYPTLRPLYFIFKKWPVYI